MTTLDWAGLDRFHATPPVGEPSDWRTYWAGRDDVHGAILAVLSSATKSLVISMYGYDDPEFDAVIRTKCSDAGVFVQLNLDKSQAGGKAEKAILAEWDHEAWATSVAVGQSAHGAISHLKVAIVDGLYTVTGSTNWSAGGESKQDNVAYVCRDPMIAADHRARCDAIHTDMLRQQARRLTGATAPQP